MTSTVSRHAEHAKPKVSDSRAWLRMLDDDFTDSVCLLLPKGQATLIDVWAFEQYGDWPWTVMGRTISYTERQPVRYIPGYFGKCGHGRRRIPAKKDFHLLPRKIYLALNPRDRDKFHKEVTPHIDHRNRNPWDNRSSNLRIATPSQNAHNKAKGSRGSSRYKGVSKLASGKWKAQITLRGKCHVLGTFDDEFKAAQAYNAFVRKNCPEFGYINPLTIEGSD